MTTSGKILRAVAGLVVVVVLLFVVSGWYNEYKKATPSKKSGETSQTVTASSTPSGKPAETSPADQLAQSTERVVVLIDGLNFREKPDATGVSIRGLKKGETFILLARNGTWLKIQDPAGTVGWVTNNPQYVKIEKKK